MTILDGQILTTKAFDTKQGIEIQYFVKTNHGPAVLRFTQQKLVFFIESDANFQPPSNVKYERITKPLKSFNHKNCDVIYLHKLNDLETVKQYCSQNGIRTYEIDIQISERFLMERFIFSRCQFQGDFNEDEYKNKVFLNPQIRPGAKSVHMSNVSLDIETGVAGELYSIGLAFEDFDEKNNYVLMLTDIETKNQDYIEFYQSEKDLILRMIQLIQYHNPDFILGWHVVGFDLKFLSEKAQTYSMTLNLGRSGNAIKLYEKKGLGFFADIDGRVIIDGPPALRSNFFSYKNYKLETVASEVIGSSKDIASDENKVGEIERRFKEDKIALAKYNLLDCELVTKIYHKLNIFNLLLMRSYISGLLLDRINMSTAAFDFVYLPKLHRLGHIAPNRIDIEREDSSSGGMVIEPKAGNHKNVAVFDFKSLYPSIMRTFNIDPIARIYGDQNKINTPAGVSFSRDKNILSETIASLLNKREMAKESQNASLSQAIKILMNSFYGVMGSTRCRFYHSDLPIAITQTGHWILKNAIEFFENRGYEVLYGDTDSIFVKFTQKLDIEDYHSLASEVDQYLGALIKDEYNTESHLVCEFEKIYDQIYFSQSRDGNSVAKKRYAGIYDGKIEFKGMEFVRSDWTELAKEFQFTLFENFFFGNDITIIIKDYIKKIEDGQFDEKLVYTKRLSKAPEEYTKNIPVHVKAALKVNHTGPYRLKEVSYIMTKSGPEPIQNSIGQIDYQHYIEKQIRPIAQDLLRSLDTNFDSLIMGDQLSLF